MNNQIKHTAHSNYRCQYHIMFAPKYRRKNIWSRLRVVKKQAKRLLHVSRCLKWQCGSKLLFLAQSRIASPKFVQISRLMDAPAIFLANFIQSLKLFHGIAFFWLTIMNIGVIIIMYNYSYDLNSWEYYARLNFYLGGL